MSTLVEYLALGNVAEEQVGDSFSPAFSEIANGQDDLHDYVTLNLWNNGNNLGNYGYMSSQLFTKNYNGWYREDASLFDVGGDDFTVRIQFGLGGSYPYAELEDQSTIPILCVGPGQVYDSPFLLAMTNPGRPNTVQKGDIFFSLTDTNSNRAYCYLGSGNWYLPTYPGKMHLEFSRRGSVFSLRYNGLYGQKEVNNTFASFGSVDLSSFTRSYILSSSITGSVSSAPYALQVTKGISRTVGTNCIGKYGNTFRFPSQPMAKRLHSSDYMLHNLSKPIWGLLPPRKTLSAVADTGTCKADETANGNVLTNDTGEYLRIVGVGGSAANVGTSVAGSNGGVFAIDFRGNWTFDPSGDFAALSGTDTATTSVTYHASNGDAEAMATLTVTVSSAASVPTDPLWSYVSLCINPAGEDGSTVITDAKGATLVVGAGVAIDTEALGVSAILNTGANGITVTNADVIPRGTEDFCIEAFLRKTSSPVGYETLIEAPVTGGLQVYFGQVQGQIRLARYGVDFQITTPLSSMPVGSLKHLAVSRKGTAFNIYIDGVQVSSTTSSVSYATPATQTIMANLKALCTGMRVTRGHYRYDSNFTPPSLPFPEA